MRNKDLIPPGSHTLPEIINTTIYIYIQPRLTSLYVYTYTIIIIIIMARRVVA